MKRKELETKLEELEYKSIDLDFEFDGKRIEIYNSSNATQDPLSREYGNYAPRFLSCNKHYTANKYKYIFDGEKWKLPADSFDTPSEIEAWFKRHDFVYHKVNAYIHDGIYFNPKYQTYRWDSGCYGFLYYEKKEYRKIYGLKKITQKELKRASNFFIKFCAYWQDYLNGDLWLLKVDDNYLCEGNYEDCKQYLYSYFKECEA